MVYHSVLLVFKVLQSKEPKPLYKMFPTDYKYKNTSQAQSNSIKQIGHPSLDIAKDSFRWKAAKLFNQLPTRIKTICTLETFKLESKKWVEASIQVHCSQT